MVLPIFPATVGFSFNSGIPHNPATQVIVESVNELYWAQLIKQKRKDMMEEVPPQDKYLKKLL